MEPASLPIKHSENLPIPTALQPAMDSEQELELSQELTSQGSSQTFGT